MKPTNVGTLVVAALLNLPLPALEGQATTQTVVGAPGDLFITNGTVIDGTVAEPIPDGAVLVRGDSIIWRGPRTEASVPRGVFLIDAAGGTIMPGLINTHVHHSAPAEQRRRFLEEGVTSVCDLGTPLAELPDFLAPAPEGRPVARGFFTGPILTAVGGYPDGLYGTTHFNYAVATPDEAPSAVRDLLDRGASFIKVAMDPSWNVRSPLPMLDAERSRAIVNAAHGEGVLVRAHIIQITHFPLGLEAGIDVVEHMPFPTGWPTEAEIASYMDGSDPLEPFFDDHFPQYGSLLAKMAREGVVMVPTVSALLSDYLVRPELNQREQYVRDVILDIIRRFREAGGVVAVGNDFNDRSVTERLPLTEMKALRRAGLTPMEVIEAGTSIAARVCGQEQSLGTLEAGKLADIVVVDGNPLVDLDALSRVTAIVLGGEIVRPHRR